MSESLPSEGSPLLKGEAGMRRDWEGTDRQGSRRALLGDAWDGSRRRGSQDSWSGEGGPGRNRSAATAAFRKRWKVSAALAGVVMFSMALAGLVAIFSTIQRPSSPVASSTSSPLERIKKVVTTPSVAGAPMKTNSTPSGAQGKTESREKVAVVDTRRSTGGDKETREEVAASEPKVGSEPKVEDGQQRDKGITGKPNVFFIMIDDMGWNDIGYQSIDLQGVTPNLDRLAAGGVKLKTYYSMSICTPARASLMTGRYVNRYGMQYNVIQPGAPWGLPLTEKLFPEYMKDNGYETHMIGKWHIGSYTHLHVPSQRGFDTFMGYLNDEEMYWTHQSWSAQLNGRKFFDFGFGNATGYYDIIDRPIPDHPRNGSVDDDGAEDELSQTSSVSSSVSETSNTFRGRYSTELFHNRAIDILEEKTPWDEEPLYMYLAHQAVHDPLGLPPNGSFSPEEEAILDAIEADSDDDGHLRKRFAKVLMFLDQTIGEMMGYLEEKGWMENSIIMVASDNGGCPSTGGSNYPLRGVKHSYWEGGLKVPAFVYSQSHIPEARWGSEYYGAMHVTDWLPTLATGAGLELTGAAGVFDGIDQWEYIVNGDLTKYDKFASPREEMMYNFDPYILWIGTGDSFDNAEYNLAQGAFRSGKYKYLASEWCSGWYTFNLRVLGSDSLTNVTTACGGSPCSDCGQGCTEYNYTDYLFDLEADPREETNLIEVYPDLAHSMRERWVELAFSEYADSIYESIDHEAYYVWAKYNWWMVPWWGQVGKSTEDSSSGLNSTTSEGGSSSSSTVSSSLSS